VLWDLVSFILQEVVVIRRLLLVLKCMFLMGWMYLLNLVR